MVNNIINNLCETYIYILHSSMKNNTIKYYKLNTSQDSKLKCTKRMECGFTDLTILIVYIQFEPSRWLKFIRNKTFSKSINKF